MALFERKYESKNGNISWAQMLKAKLNGYFIENEYEYAIEIITSNDCDHAKQFEGQLFEHKDIFEKFPVSNDKCLRNNGCLCFLGCTAKRDNNGRIKMRRSKP